MNNISEYSFETDIVFCMIYDVMFRTALDNIETLEYLSWL